MNTKFITPKVHGIIDYAFAATLLLAPPLLSLNKKVIKFYRNLACGSLTYSALTDYPAGIKPVITYQQHHKIDCAFIAVLFAAFFNKEINQDSHTCIFHDAVTTGALFTVLFTDWRAGSRNRQTTGQVIA